NARIIIARERDRGIGMIRAVGTDQSRCTQCRLERHACKQHNDYDAAKRIHRYSVPEANAYGPVGLNIEGTLRLNSSIAGSTSGWSSITADLNRRGHIVASIRNAISML